MRALIRRFPIGLRLDAPQQSKRVIFYGCIPKAYSTSTKPVRTRTLRVPVGGSGNVEIDVSTPTHQHRTAPRSVLVYLPAPETYFPDPLEDAISPSSDLFSYFSTSTAVKIRYRLDAFSSPAGHAFPVPVHDVATAFDYITSVLGRPDPAGNKPKICLFGSHVGGALATMLALTQPNDIHALAVSEPLSDWVSLDEYARRSSQTGVQKAKKAASISQVESEAILSLIDLRSKLFRSPSAYFDPFASPTLFLRAPGRDTPLSHSAETEANDEDDSPREAYGPYDDDLTDSLSSPSQQPPPISSRTSTPGTDESLEGALSSSRQAPRRRKVLRRWPSIGRPESVVLPYTRIFLRKPALHPSTAQDGLAKILHSQGTELAELMRRACFFGREKGLAEERVSVQEVDGGLDETGSGVAGIEEAADWLREMIEME